MVVVRALDQLRAGGHNPLVQDNSILPKGGSIIDSNSKHLFFTMISWESSWLRRRTIFLIAFSLLFVMQGGTFAFHMHENLSQPQRTSATFVLNMQPNQSRRTFLWTTCGFSFLAISTSASTVSAFPFGDDSKDRRQKELCLVNILRLQFWAITTATTLESEDIEQRKKTYLEARLGAKAMVAKKQKMGGGATPQVFTLKSLQLLGCLDDLSYYSKYNKKVLQLQEDLIESLASIVEFDGLETTQDPSPRSSLTLGQFNEEKATYIRRMLNERVTPLTQELVDFFGPESKAQCEEYIKQYYSNEIPLLPST